MKRGIEKARKVPRLKALLKVKKKTAQNRPVLSIKFDPRLPAIQQIQLKHWRSMTGEDSYLKEVFEQPPLTAFRRQNNLRDMLIKSKIPAPIPTHPRRDMKGMGTCGKACTACHYAQKRKTVKINKKTEWKIERKVNCNTFNCIYMIQCNKDNCNKRYIGQTGRLLKFRIADRRGYIQNHE